MKTSMNQTMAAWVAASALAASVCAGQNLPTVTYDWQFGSAANPAPSGGAQATIAPGSFSAAWNAGAGVYGDSHGIWDLGKSGSITIRTAEAPAADPQSRVVTVKVVQYQDGMIYDQCATVTVPGATQVASKLSQLATTRLGKWSVEETQWSVPPGVPADTVVITGAEYGTLVDSVTVAATASTVGPLPALSIRNFGAQIEIAWPADADQAVLECNADLSNPQGWTAVDKPVVVKGSLRSVTMDAASASLFYRLKQ